MMASSKIPMFALAFAVGCSAIYALCTELNLPLVTYHPVTGEVDLWWKPPGRGPAMYWYGWMLTSLIGALVVACIAIALPEQWLQRTILFGSLAAVAYLLLYTVALFIYDRATVELEFLKSRWLSVVAALVVAAAVTALAPARWTQRVWTGWAWLVPIGALAVLGYYLTPYFTQ